MSASPISLSRQGAVTLITLDDGKANALNTALLNEFDRAIAEVDTEKGALVVAGRAGVFSGGFDLKIMTSGDMDMIIRLLKHGGETALRLLTFPRPVVMAVTGHAIAMGAILAMVPDWRVGAHGDFRVGLNEVRNHMPLPLFGLELAQVRLNPLMLVQATLHSRIFVGEEAAAVGFLDECVAPDKVVETACMRAEDLASIPHLPYRITKEQLYGPLAQRLLASLQIDMRSAFE